MQRIHCRNILSAVEEKSSKPSLVSSKTMEEMYSKFGISEGSQGFIGHGLAFYNNNDYLEEDYKDTYKRIRTYDLLRLIH